MKYYTLGNTGLRVSRLCLGTMTFGKEWGWGSEKPHSEAVFNTYVESGGNFLDTADMYTGGTSEQWLGEFIAKRKLRDKVVVSTKFSWATTPGNPNGGGNGRKHIMQSLEKSLQRLGTDYVDLYLLHVWDGITPIDDVMRTFDDIVSSGKALHVGFSDVPAWVASRGKAMCEAHLMEQPCTVQLEYSLVERNIEHEFVPLAQNHDLDIMVWSPLSGGLLTGKYKATDAGVQGDGRFAAIQEGDPQLRKLSSPKTFEIIATLEGVAKKIARPMAEVALNWVANRPGVGSVVIGATKLEQLNSNLQCLDFTIPDDLLNELDTVSQPTAPFPYSFFEDNMMRGVHAGEGAAKKHPNYYSLRQFPGDGASLVGD